MDGPILVYPENIHFVGYNNTNFYSLFIGQPNRENLCAILSIQNTSTLQKLALHVTKLMKLI